MLFNRFYMRNLFSSFDIRLLLRIALIGLSLIAIIVAGVGISCSNFLPVVVVGLLFGIPVLLVVMELGRVDWLILGILVFSIIQRGPLNLVANFSAPDGLILITLIYWALQFVTREKTFSQLQIHGVFWVAIPIIILSEVSGLIFYPHLIDTSTKQITNFLEYLVMFALVLQYCQSIERVEKILRYAVLVGILFMLITIWELNFGIAQFGPHYSLFGNTETAIGYINLETRSLFPLGLVIGFGLFKLKPKLFGFIFTSIALYILAVSTRRSAYLAVLGFGVALLWLNNRRYLPVFIILITIMANIFVFSNPQVSELDELKVTLNRLSTGEFTQGSVTASTIRFNVYVMGVQMFLQHPFWGYGMGGFGKEFYSNPSLGLLAFDSTGLREGTTNQSQSAHSQYFQVLVDYGLIVFMIFLWALWTLIKRSHHLARSNDNRIAVMGKVLFVCQVGWSLVFLFDPLLHGTGTLKPMFFYLSAALILALWRLDQEQIFGSGMVKQGRITKRSW